MGLTIIVSVYNEEECLGRFCQEMSAFLSCAPIPTTVLCNYSVSPTMEPALTGE
jgi:hypothetical protein